MYIEGMEIPNYLEEEDAIVASTNEHNTTHSAWKIDSDSIVIAAEFAEGYGMGIFLYESLDEYLEEFKGTWVLENNYNEEKLEELLKGDKK